MSVARRIWLMYLLAGFVAAAQADEVKSTPKSVAAHSSASAGASASSTATSVSTSRAVASQAANAKAAPVPVPEADDELLEFLGSVDSATGDDDWLEYLSEADIAKAAKAPKTEPAAPEVKKND